MDIWLQFMKIVSAEGFELISCLVANITTETQTMAEWVMASKQVETKATRLYDISMQQDRETEVPLEDCTSTNHLQWPTNSRSQRQGPPGQVPPGQPQGAVQHPAQHQVQHGAQHWGVGSHGVPQARQTVLNNAPPGAKHQGGGGVPHEGHQ